MATLKTRYGAFLLMLVVFTLLACQLEALMPTPTPKPTATRPKAAIAPTPVLPPAAPPAAPTEPPPPVFATATDNLRVRANPSTSAAILDRLNKGDAAEVIGRNAAGDWLYIKIPSNPTKRGWIAAPYTTTSAPIDTLPIVPPGGQPYP